MARKDRERQSRTPGKGAEIVCASSVKVTQVEMRLVFDCKNCPIEADLRKKECMAGALKALAENQNADAMVLSDYAELRYSGPGMEMLKRMVRLSDEIGNLALRDPVKEHFPHLKEGQRERQAGACASCPRGPKTLFPELRKGLLADIEEFYSGLSAAVKSAAAPPKPECAACAKATGDALVYVFNLSEEFRSFLYYEGFRVVT